MIKTGFLAKLIDETLKEITLPYPFYPFCDLIALKLNRNSTNHYTRQFIRSYLKSKGFKIEKTKFRRKKLICIIPKNQKEEVE